MTMHNCMVDDGNGNLFRGLTDNCRGELAMLHLKKAGNGHFVA